MIDQFDRIWQDLAYQGEVDPADLAQYRIVLSAWWLERRYNDTPDLIRAFIRRRVNAPAKE